jgi:hypothetical protein
MMEQFEEEIKVASHFADNARKIAQIFFLHSGHIMWRQLLGENFSNEKIQCSGEIGNVYINPTVVIGFKVEEGHLVVEKVDTGKPWIAYSLYHPFSNLKDFSYDGKSLTIDYSDGTTTRYMFSKNTNEEDFLTEFGLKKTEKGTYEPINGN